MVIESANSSVNPHRAALHRLIDIDVTVYYVSQGLGMLYTVLCTVWLVYVLVNIFSQIRNKRRLDSLRHQNSSNEYLIHIFTQREPLFRYIIFLIFLSFELIYCLCINTFFGTIKISEVIIIQIEIGPECFVDSRSFVGTPYDTRPVIVMLNVFSLLQNYSFSMMIWLFGASLLHLSFAARNELRMKKVLLFTILGVVTNFVITASANISYTSLFGCIGLSLMDQISLFVTLYIARRKFFPAMNSRVIDAYHLHNTNVYLQQRRLLKQYKVIVFVFLFTFELYVLKNLIFFNLYAIFDTIGLNPCWFHVVYHLPMFSLEKSTRYLLQFLSYCFLVVDHLTNIIIYVSIIIVNVNILYVSVKRWVRQNFRNRQTYRYQVCSDPLLT